ncbi:unnamed protein product [Rhizopus stolonifer]
MASQLNYENVNDALYTECCDYKHSNLTELDQYTSNTNLMLYDWNNCMISPRLTHDHPERGVAGCLEDNEQSYARWCKHNGIDMFVIDCIPEFTETVLPKLFKHCKFASFVRQLNIYGFQRDTDARKSKDSKGRDACRWYHKYFKPGHRDLFHLIRRKPPRYSRTRKQRAEKPTESVLNAESEDEVSESNEDKRRDSISSTSSSYSITLHPMAPQHSNREGSQNSFLIHDPPSMTPPMITSITHHQSPLNYYYSSELSCFENNMTMNQFTTEEEALKHQIAYLQEKYVRMHNSLTDEVSRAFSFIQTQKSRINFLESLLQQRLSLNTCQSLSPTDQFSVNMALQNSPQEAYCTPLYNVIGQQSYTPPSCASSTSHGNLQNQSYILPSVESQDMHAYGLSLHNNNESTLLL